MRSDPGRPLSDSEFEELDEFLTSEDRPENCMGMSMLDGFFAAIAIRPDLVLPGVWLPEIWGSEEGGGYRDFEEANHILSLVMRYHNDVVRHLRENAEEFEPGFYERSVLAAAARSTSAAAG